MLTVESRAHFVDQSRREGVRVADRGSLGPDCLVTVVEASAVGESVERPGLEAHDIGETIAAENLILLAEVVIDSHIEGVGVVGVVTVGEIIVEQAGVGRIWKEIEELHCIRVQPVARDQIAREQIARPAACHRPGRGRIENCAGRERATETIGTLAALKRDQI